MPAPPSTVRVQTRFADLGPLGHVNHTQFLVYMETARMRFLDEHWGEPRRSLVVARSECDHRHGIPPQTQEVAVTVQVESVGRTSVAVRHEIFDGERTAAVGRVVLVAVDEHSRPRPVTDEERDRLLSC